MPVAGQVKVCLGFRFHRRRKMTNLIENEIHVTPETIFIYSAILARTEISKHSAILKGTFCRILRFWQRKEINRKQDILEDWKYFDLDLPSVSVRIEPTSSLFTRPAKRTKRGRKGLQWCGFALFLVRFCRNFHFNSRYCGFTTLSGLRLLQPLGRGFRWKKCQRWWYSSERSASGYFASASQVFYYNYGLFQLPINVINRFGQWCINFVKFHAGY